MKIVVEYRKSSNPSNYAEYGTHIVFFRFFHSIIGLVVKFPLAMREPRVRYDTLLRFLTIVPNDAISFSFLQHAVESPPSLSNVRITLLLYAIKH